MRQRIWPVWRVVGAGGCGRFCGVAGVEEAGGGERGGELAEGLNRKGGRKGSDAG